MTKRLTRRTITHRFVSTLLATHLLPSIVVTTMTTALAYGNGQRSSLWLLILAVLFGQFCIGWTNDYLDRHRDRAAGRAEKPIVSGVVQARTIRTLAIVAFVAAILFSLAYSIAATTVYIVALGSALLYNFRFKNSILSVVSYIVSFALLPVYVALGSPIPFVPNIWIILALALWGVGVHIQNVIPDFEYDAKTGIKGAAHRLSKFSAMLISGTAFVLSVGALSMAYVARASMLLWLVVGGFVIAASVFIVFLFARNLPLAYKVSVVMTGVVTLLIMLSGPYLA